MTGLQHRSCGTVRSTWWACAIVSAPTRPVTDTDVARFWREFDTPPGFEIMDVESGLVAGVWRDEFDIEHVRVYRQTLVPDGE